MRQQERKRRERRTQQWEARERTRECKTAGQKSAGAKRDPVKVKVIFRAFGVLQETSEEEPGQSSVRHRDCLFTAPMPTVHRDQPVFVNREKEQNAKYRMKKGGEKARHSSGYFCINGWPVKDEERHGRRMRNDTRARKMRENGV